MSIVIIEEAKFLALLKEIEAIKKSLMKGSNDRDEVWLTSKEVCRLFHISPKTLWTYRNEKVIPFVQRGSVIRYQLSEIEAAFSRFKSGERKK